MTKYVVFLDIDGVFTSERIQTTACIDYQMWSKFDPVAIGMMNWIHLRYDVDFVLITSWKNHIRTEDSHYYHWIVTAFYNAGFLGNFPFDDWKTNPENSRDFKDRAYEIKQFLIDHPEYEDFIIFDDTDYDFARVLGKKRLIRTSSSDGLLSKNIRDAKAMMGLWKPKTGVILNAN